MGPLVGRSQHPVATLILCGGALFVSAGRLSWPGAWIYLGYLILSSAAIWSISLRLNPAVIEARSRIRAGTKLFDGFFAAGHAVLVLATFVVAGLDAVRYRWAPLGPTALYAGGVLLLLGALPVGWAMAANPYLETSVRIQTDRGHKVVASGPYASVRHPMYVGLILNLAAAPLVLGSRWAFAPVSVDIALLVWRTLLEDRTLRAELPGYEEYTARTRYRLLPGVW